MRAQTLWESVSQDSGSWEEAGTYISPKGYERNEGGSLQWTWYGGSLPRTLELSSVVRLDTVRDNIDRTVRGFQHFVCVKEVAVWKIFHRLQGRGEAFELYRD